MRDSYSRDFRIINALSYLLNYPMFIQKATSEYFKIAAMQNLFNFRTDKWRGILFKIYTDILEPNLQKIPKDQTDRLKLAFKIRREISEYRSNYLENIQNIKCRDVKKFCVVSNILMNLFYPGFENPRKLFLLIQKYNKMNNNQIRTQRIKYRSFLRKFGPKKIPKTILNSISPRKKIPNYAKERIL